MTHSRTGMKSIFWSWKSWTTSTRPYMRDWGAHLISHPDYRIHPPIPIAFMRVVPMGGATLNGHFVPEGVMLRILSIWRKTLAGVQAYTMCQDPEIFPNPQQYYPSRWIGKDMKENMSNLHMFSCTSTYLAELIIGGPRICLGKEYFHGCRN